MADYYIVAVHLSGGTEPQHIADVIWVNEETMEGGKSTRAAMVKFINGGGSVKVSDGKTRVAVEVVKGDPPYIRSEPDPSKTDNLLALPRF